MVRIQRHCLALGLLALSASQARAGSVPTETAAKFFTEMEAISRRDDGKLWGKPLYGPMMFVDSATHFAVGNQPDAQRRLHKKDGVYAGQLPADVIVSNTATDWARVKWTMVCWPLPKDETQRGRLMAHECWHRIQDSLGLPAANPTCAHLDTLEGRYWLQLEWRALAKALVAEGDARKQAIRDACLFRARRRSGVKGAADNERSLEMNEGLAEYTGFKVGSASDSQARSDLSKRLRTAGERPTFVRSFAYESGPAFGLLLDAIGSDWRRGLTPANELEGLLLGAIHSTLPKDLDAEGKKRAKEYDGDALRKAEEKRDRDRQQKLTAYKKMFVDGPILEIPMVDAHYGFDPNTLIPLDPTGTVYPTLEVSDVWGKLEAKEGAVITSDYHKIIVVAPKKRLSSTSKNADTADVSGPGWTLSLKAGWTIKPGKRAGDFFLVHE